jgi:enamine deaminase RidA (YjgF/YER057c/UK114 family)
MRGIRVTWPPTSDSRSTTSRRSWPGAGMTVADVVKLNIYTTDVGALLQNFGVLAGRFGGTPDRFASSVLGVASLAGPDLLVALEATAMD